MPDPSTSYLSRDFAHSLLLLYAAHNQWDEYLAVLRSIAPIAVHQDWKEQAKKRQAIAVLRGAL